MLSYTLNSTPSDMDDYDDLSLEETVEYIEWLMRWYCQQPSLMTARLITCRLQALKSRDEVCEVSNAGWSCDRLIKIWNYIADQNHPLAT